jgi:hypothetical protein
MKKLFLTLPIVDKNAYQYFAFFGHSTLPLSFTRDLSNLIGVPTTCHRHYPLQQLLTCHIYKKDNVFIYIHINESCPFLVKYSNIYDKLFAQTLYSRVNFPGCENH